MGLFEQLVQRASSADPLHGEQYLPLGGLQQTPEEAARRLLLSAMLTTTGLNPPPNGSWDYISPMPANIGWDDFGNNTKGDCVEAAILHWIMAATNMQGRIIRPPSSAGPISYREITGFSGTGPGPGTSPPKALSYWRHTGFPTSVWQPPQIINPFSGSIAANKLFVILQPPNPISVGQPLSGVGVPVGTSIKTKNTDGTFMLAVPNGAVLDVAAEPMSTKFSPQPVVQGRDRCEVYLFQQGAPGSPALIDKSMAAGYNFVGALLTVGLPKAWQNAPVWDVAPAGHENDPNWQLGSWGWHWVWWGAGSPTGHVMLTWGKPKPTTTAALGKYFTDLTVPFSENLLDPVTLTTVSGFDRAAALAWLAANGSPVTP